MNGLKLFVFRCAHYVLRHINQLDELVYEQLIIHRDSAKVEAIEEFSPVSPDPIFENISVITHAGGGIGGLSYLNCQEAFKHYYYAGNRVFEYDVVISQTGDYVLAHDLSLIENGLIDERFHPLTLEECLQNVRDYSDLTVIFDCKFSKLEDFAQTIKDSLINEDELQRIIIQVFNEQNIDAVRDVWPFKLLYVCMRETDYHNALKLCSIKNISATSVPIESIRNSFAWKTYTDKNVKVFAYTVNKMSEAHELYDMGIRGFFSDYITQTQAVEFMHKIWI